MVATPVTFGNLANLGVDENGDWNIKIGGDWYKILPATNPQITGAITVNEDTGVTGEYDNTLHTLKKLKVKGGIITELEVEDIE